MDDSATLLEIEAIKQLKARYCRLLDTKDWQGWRDLFSDDFLSDTSSAGGKVIRGADEFVAFTRKGLRNQATVHQVHAPEIELTSPTTARGVWALEDVVRFGPGSIYAATATTPKPTRRSTGNGGSPARHSPGCAKTCSTALWRCTSRTGSDGSIGKVSRRVMK